MKTKTTLAMLAILGALALTASAQDNTPPAGGPPDGAQPPVQRAAGPKAGYHLLPPPLVQQMNLTDDQKTQIAALETDTKAKLEKILTADQLKQLNSFRPPGRPGMRGGQGRGSQASGDGDGNPPPPPGDNQ